MKRLQLVQIDKLSLRIAQVAAVGIVIMMLLVTVEVLSRKVFGISTHVAHEYSGYLMVLVVFWGAGQAVVERQHIRITLLIDRFKGFSRISIRMCHVIAVAYVSILLWASATLVVISCTSNVMTWGVYQIPIFIPQLIIPIGVFFLLLQLIASLVRVFRVQDE